MKTILPSRTSALVRLSRLLSSTSYASARFFILVDENTYNHCLPALVANVEPLQQAEFMEVPVGEDCKDIAIATQLWQTLLESGADHDTVLVNLGGGSVTDLGGFVAATYKRGIRHINIPTTLIGMVDAAIGGKTALNLGIGGPDDTTPTHLFKNPVGLFHQPSAVCIHTPFLHTLPQPQLIDGTFEMLKTFLVADPVLYNNLCQALLGGSLQVQPDHIAACANIKNAVVRRDPFDRSARRILNLGHTFGHAIEAFSLRPGRQPLGHGTAVGIGLLCALYLSVRKLGLDPAILDRYRAVATKLIALPHYTLRDTEDLLTYMRQDKKNRSGNILCVLLSDIGAPVIDLPVSENEIRDALLKIS